jgi:hypothetical protein
MENDRDIHFMERSVSAKVLGQPFHAGFEIAEPFCRRERPGGLPQLLEPKCWDKSTD